jgi:hypothetical protein
VSSVAPGAGAVETPPEAATSTVSGATDQGTVTAEPTPTSGGESTTTVTATSAPTDPTTTTSRTAEPTTSSSRSTPPSRTRPSVDGGSTVATGSAPVDGAPAAVRPAAHHAPLGEPGSGKRRAEPPAGGTHAAGSVTADAADATGSPLKVVRTVGREPAAHPSAHRAPVVLTTVPRPAPDAAHADAADVPAHARAKSEISRGR